MKFQTIIKHYERNAKPRKDTELNWFRRQPDLVTAIKIASEAKDHRGKRYSHQSRITKQAISEAKKVLLENIEDIEKSNSFHNLLMSIEKLLRPIRGIADLYIYDTSLRIGAFLDLLPEKVYLHAGTKKGASVAGIKGKNDKWLETSELPDELQCLPMHEIEDVLCIYKDDLMKVEISDKSKPC